MKMYLHRIRIDSQGYDRNGYYFGTGASLYHYENVDDADISGYVRGTTRDAAKQAVAATIAKAIDPDAKLTFFGCLVAGAILAGVISCPTGAVAAPLCTFVVATDAPNPVAIYHHETWHCWGWTHSVSANKGATDHFDTKMRAPIAPWYYRMKGEYPNKIVYYMLGRDVAKQCDGNVYGCQWGGYAK